MTGKVLNIKVSSPLKLRSGLNGNYHAICHYSYNLPLCIMFRMTQELSEIEFKKTFGNGMTDITETEFDEPIDIWSYVEELTENQIVNRIVYEKELVEKVYRNDLKTFDHILLPTEKQNVLLTIVVDLEKKKIFGHKILDLNKEYGIE